MRLEYHKLCHERLNNSASELTVQRSKKDKGKLWDRIGICSRRPSASSLVGCVDLY